MFPIFDKIIVKTIALIWRVLLIWIYSKSLFNRHSLNRQFLLTVKPKIKFCLKYLDKLGDNLNLKTSTVDFS